MPGTEPVAKFRYRSSAGRTGCEVMPFGNTVNSRALTARSCLYSIGSTLCARPVISISQTFDVTLSSASVRARIRLPYRSVPPVFQ